MTGMFNKRIPILAAFLVLSGLATNAMAENATPRNLAPLAKIAASSEFSKAYSARFVADGQIPRPMSQNDRGKAWCAKGADHKNGVEITFEWPAPVDLAELVYYGRTAFQRVENWKDYEVILDHSARPVVSGAFTVGHGPQRVKLPEQSRARVLTLRLLTNYGGSNPGAAEIGVYSKSPPDSLLGKFIADFEEPKKAPTASPVPESPELANELREGKLGFAQLLLIKRQSINPTHVYTYHSEGLKAGGGLYLLDVTKPDEPKQLIDSSDGIVLDCNLSYDGRTALFSWKRSMDTTFQLFTIDLADGALSQLTDHDSNNLNACWLPDGGIAFLSDRKPAFAYCWTSTTPILYRCDRDGSNTVRLSANYLNDFTPSVMDDGRIVYSRWEYVDRPAIPIQSLWTINPDGTGLAGYFGNRVLSPATFMEAREIAGTGKVLAVLTSHNGPCRGAIGIVDPTKGANAQDAIRNLTPEINIGLVDKGAGNNVRGPYESPFPIDDQYFLVSRAGTILLRDYDGAAQVTLLEGEDSLGYYTPRPVMGRRRPAVRSREMAEDMGDWSTLLIQDVYNGLAPHVKRGEIERIAVVQEMEKAQFANKELRAFGFQFPVVSCGATYAPKKVWGFAKVEADGSAHFRAPARVPIYFMALDANGLALQRMRSFTHMMPGERQSCMGCHADRNYAAPSSTERTIASLRPPQELEEPEWGVTGFSYPHIVQPVLDKHCVECHNATKQPHGVDLCGDKTDFFNVSYEVLARQGKPGQNPYTKWIPTYNGQEANIPQVAPRHWGSPASKLADIILSGHPDKDGEPRVDVAPSEQRRVFAWIDLNVPYYGTSASNHYDLKGCRQLLPDTLDSVLKDVSSRRCASCHEENNLPRSPYVRVTNIENNDFLLAPLAKSAGGTEACGQIVFSLKQDADYQKLVKAFEPIDELIAERPRIDMARPF